jgi:hypothetical protein
MGSKFSNEDGSCRAKFLSCCLPVQAVKTPVSGAGLVGVVAAENRRRLKRYK